MWKGIWRENKKQNSEDFNLMWTTFRSPEQEDYANNNMQVSS